MYQILIVSSVLILFCIFSTKLLYRFGVPSLLIFLAFGMLMGSDGIGGISFDDFELMEHISSLALALIIFHGGFGTNWSAAKPVAVKAMLLSSLGTVITAFIAGAICCFVLKIPFLYGLLFGAVISSTDAASVFSILRARKLRLKSGLAPLLEVESGSNDPFAYLLTITVISAIGVHDSGLPIPALFGTLALQIGFGLSIGALMSLLLVVLLKHLNLQMDGLYPILLLAAVILCYSVCVLIGGNGLLCVYILGIVVGNSKICQKTRLEHFFDGISWLMQIMLFFLLGLLSFPARIPALIIPGTIVSVAIIFIARPVSVLSILSWFKVPIKQQFFISWVGLRGAASLAFAIAAAGSLGDKLPYDLFHIVFYVALFSVSVQGTLTPLLAKKLNLADGE